MLYINQTLPAAQVGLGPASWAVNANQSEPRSIAFNPTEVLLLAIAICSLVSITIIRIQEHQGIALSRERIELAETALRSSGALMTALLDAETGQRGYLLTQSQDYLGPYERAVQTIPPLLDGFEKSSLQVGIDVPRVTGLSLSIREKMDELSTTIRAYRSHGRAAALRIVRSGKGNKLTQRVRTEYGQLEAQYLSIVVQNSKEVEARSRMALWISVVGNSIALIALMSAALRLNTAFVRKRKLLWQVHESEHRYRMMAERLECIREQERAKLAREIHDAIGGVLTGIKFDISIALRRIREQSFEAIIHRLNEATAGIDETIRSIRRISSELRPPLLDHLGLEPALAVHAEEFQRRTGIRVHLTSDNDFLSLDSDKAITFFRIFQEALTNVARHSGASDVDVLVTVSDDVLTLTVQDDGIGFEASDALAKGSLGLLGMQERARLVDAELSIDSKPGQGARISVTMPLGAAHAEEAVLGA